MDKAAKVAVEKYPHGTFDGEIGDSLRAACAVGYMQAEKDMKEWFIQFVRRHYPLNYVGWIKDFERAWEENNG